MSHVYLFSHVGLYVLPYLLNYITSLYWKLSENYKHGCRNDQPICKNKGSNESNETNNLRFFQNNLGLVFHTTYCCIFHSCYLILHIPLLYFPLLLSAPAFSTPAFSTRAIYSWNFHSRIFSRPTSITCSGCVRHGAGCSLLTQPLHSAYGRRNTRQVDCQRLYVNSQYYNLLLAIICKR